MQICSMAHRRLRAAPSAGLAPRRVAALGAAAAVLRGAVLGAAALGAVAAVRHHLLQRPPGGQGVSRVQPDNQLGGAALQHLRHVRSLQLPWLRNRQALQHGSHGAARGPRDGREGADLEAHRRRDVQHRPRVACTVRRSGGGSGAAQRRSPAGGAGGLLCSALRSPPPPHTHTTTLPVPHPSPGSCCS